MSTLSEFDRDLLFHALLSHQRIPTYVGNGQRCVGCDNLHGEPDGSNSPRHTHHLADALAPVVERIVAARVGEVVERVEALAERWEREADERGPDDRLWTVGVAAMVRAALRPAEPPDDPGTPREGRSGAQGGAEGAREGMER